MSLIINHTLIPGRRECTFEDLKDEEIRKIFEVETQYNCICMLAAKEYSSGF